MNSILRHTVKLAVLIVAMLAIHTNMTAQIKLVTGFVYNASNKKEKKPLDTSEIPLMILGYNNEQAAKDDLEKYKNTPTENLYIYGFEYSNDSETKVDNYGQFEIEIALSGALLVKYGADVPIFVPINGQMHVEVGIIVGQQLEEVSVKGKFSGIGKLDCPPAIQHGNKIVAPRTGILVSDDYISGHARLTIMPYVLNHSKHDTAHYRKPRVYDSKEFHLTQQRWAGYENCSDSLMRYVQKEEFAKGHNEYEWQDTIIVPNADDHFQLVADIIVEDYLGKTFYVSQHEITPRYPRKPMKFLEYTMEAYELDPMDYRERPKRERRDQAAKLDLTFIVGRAEIDYSNLKNKEIMDSLQSEFNRYIYEESDVTFKSLILSSVSSPDGTLSANKSLAKRRLDFARSEITKMFPSQMLSRMYIEAEKAEVATWEDVAKLMEKDSLLTEAQGIRDIIAKNPNQDLQSAKMRSLPYYDIIRDKYLPQLRSMSCKYTIERYRALTPDEILDLYHNDPGYKSGKKKFELYEYWSLFQTVKDTMELERLYKDAYEVSRERSANGVPWILAANNLAVSYIKRDTVDLNVLAPFLNDSLRINAKRYGRQLNQPELVANQAIMYMKKGEYDKAINWAWRLKGMSKYNGLTDIILCLGGHYLVDEALFNRVKNNTTPLNHVVMCLAVGTEEYAKEAVRVLDAMDNSQNDAKLLYLRAIAYSRLGSAFEGTAQMTLAQCFNIGYESGDKSWVELAKTDGDINEDLFETAYYSSYWYLFGGEEL